MKKLFSCIIAYLVFQGCTDSYLNEYKDKINAVCRSKSDGLVDLENKDFDYIIHSNTLYLSEYNEKIPNKIIDKANNAIKKLTPFDGDVSALFFFRKNELIGTILYNELDCALNINIYKVQTNYFKKNEHLYFIKIPEPRQNYDSEQDVR